jgi:hypothetical protein
MKRAHVVLLAAASLCFTNGVSAQMGMNLFKKPNISDIFKPVVGSGAVYEQTSTREKNSAPNQMEMTIVDKQLVDGEQGYWMEVAHQSHGQGPLIYSKILVTKNFDIKKVVFQMPGQGAMEMPFNAAQNPKTNMQEQLEKWHQVGTETITVPAGTFSCAHWKKDTGNDDVWVSDKVTPMSLVKQVGDTTSMTLVKVINNATDHITGPVQKFDPQALQRQMMQQRQQPQ